MEKPIDTCKKLLALAEGTDNPNEAALAMERLGVFLAKHGLEMSEIRTEHDIEDNIIRDEFTSWNKKFKPWESSLGHRIANAFRTESVQQTSRTKKSKLFFIGTKSDIELILYYFQFLRKDIHWESQVKYPHNIANRNTFCYGATISVTERLEIMQRARDENVPSDSLALVLATEARIKKRFEEEFPKLGTARKHVLSGVPDAFYQGQDYGDTIELNTPIKQPKKREAIK